MLTDALDGEAREAARVFSAISLAASGTTTSSLACQACRAVSSVGMQVYSVKGHFRLSAEVMCGVFAFDADPGSPWGIAAGQTPATCRGVALIAGGETTVTLAGDGIGGRNQVPWRKNCVCRLVQ